MFYPKKVNRNTRLKNNIAIKENKFKKIVWFIIIMAVCTSVSMLSHRFVWLEASIVMIYLLGILFISFLSQGYAYSFAASIFAILLYNYFFTEPYYTFKVDNPNYLITFTIMFIVGSITSMLTIRLKLETQMAEEREKYISSLYHIEKKLLNVKSKEDLGQISAEEIAKTFVADVVVRFFDSNEISIFYYIEGEDLFGGEDDMSACQESFHSGSPCGNGTGLFSGAKGYYSPIFTQYGVLGVVGISQKTRIILTDEQKTFLEMIIPQIAVVLQREKNYEKQQKTQIEMQRERLRADMLRSISHDFRTPLAGVMGLASTLIDNYDKMNDEVKKNFLQSIYEDADWLNEIVENILQTTRFEEGRMQLNIAEEASEEIITEAVTHVKKHAEKHRIHVNIPDEIIWVRVDGVLIKQVLINILNNAISYSPANTDIYVSLFLEDDYAVFEIKDSGPGILPGELSHIFERYHRSGTNGTTNRKGMGLGLALCKSIIEAHNGKISVQNNNPHGTIVSFYLEAERSD